MKNIIRYFQKGFNYCQDGPGNRLVYHLQGCNLLCPWCSNPEGMNINSSCQSATVDEIYDEIIRSKAMFFDGGGVTFSGGEPSMQKDALLELFKRLKEAGITTAIETNSTVPQLAELLPYLDFPMLDFKHCDKDKFRAITGGNIEIVFKNLRRAAELCPALAVRIPLIGHFNNDIETAHKMAKFLSEINYDGLTVEILPYHEYGKEKWRKLGLEYKMHDAKISRENLKEITEIFKSENLKLINT